MLTRKPPGDACWPSWRDIDMPHEEVSPSLPPVPPQKLAPDRQMEMGAQYMAMMFADIWGAFVEFTGERSEQFVREVCAEFEADGREMGKSLAAAYGITDEEKKDLRKVLQLISWFGDWPCGIRKEWLELSPSRARWREYTGSMSPVIHPEFYIGCIGGSIRGQVSGIRGVPIEDIVLEGAYNPVLSGEGDYYEFTLE